MRFTGASVPVSLAATTYCIKGVTSLRFLETRTRKTSKKRWGNFHSCDVGRKISHEALTWRRKESAAARPTSSLKAKRKRARKIELSYYPRNRDDRGQGKKHSPILAGDHDVSLLIQNH